jgi:hypothetical protein
MYEAATKYTQVSPRLLMYLSTEALLSYNAALVKVPLLMSLMLGSVDQIKNAPVAAAAAASAIFLP